MNVIGLDLSLTATGVATADGTTVIKSKAKGMERLDDIRAGIDQLIPVDDPVVYVEGYSYGSKFSHAHSLGELGGLIRWCLWSDKTPYFDVPPKSLKLFAAGKGNAGKPDMLDAARREGYEGSNDDNCVDAWWLRQFGLYVAGNADVKPYAYRDVAIATYAKESA